MVLLTRRSASHRYGAAVLRTSPSAARIKLWSLSFWVLAAMACVFTSRASAQTFNEYQLKAVFLFNFAQFVDWPPTSLQSDKPFSICVLGQNPFENYLDDAVHGESLNNRSFVVEQHRSTNETGNCNILFVSSSEAHRFPQILSDLKGHSILTVSDIDNFAQSGGMVEFVTVQKRVRFKINVDAARAAELTISSKLLRPAIIVAANGT